MAPGGKAGTTVWTVPVEVRILGPLEVLHGELPVVIRGSKERALLVRLALEPGRVVSCGRLVDSLWDGEPPASAEVSLRVLVSRVRKALSTAGAGDVLQTRPPGYVLLAEEVDAARFETLSARGRSELAAGRSHQAAATFAEALGLWRGDTLAEVVSDDLRAEATRLEQSRLTTLEARIEADLACGRHTEVLTELEALCHAHPLREGLWALWITALYRGQRQADALAAYQRLRLVLTEDLGIDPSPPLQRLEAAVLAQDPMLTGPPRTGHPSGRTALSLPTPLDLVERAPLVGRDQELEAARTAWTSAAGGASGVLLVSGEAGIGKSRLLRELARDVHGRGSVVLYGRCDEDLAIPYRPFVECLSHAIAHVSEDVLAAVDPRRLAELTRLIPSLESRRPGLPPVAAAESDVERYLLFGAVGSLLAAMASDTPVMVIVEDLHWADRPTLVLLRHLAGLNLGRILLVGTYRDRDHSDGPLVEMLGALPKEAPVTRIAPGRLAQSDALDLMTATGGKEPDDAAGQLANLLHRETGGNPFYLVEMMSHLWETGVITESLDGRCSAPADFTALSLPAGIRDVLRARVSMLGSDVSRVLSEAAVIGQEFELDVLAHTTGLDRDRLLDLLEVAGRTALVDEAPDQPGRFRFAHALVQHTLYGDIGPTRRTLAHARVGTAMEVLGGRQPGELAFHFLAGITPATTSKAVGYARAAGDRALATSAPEEAVRWYSAALHALPPPRDDTDHVRALVDLGGAQRQAGQPAYRDTLLGAARMAQRSGANGLLIEAALASCRGSFSSLGQVDAEKIAVLESALEVAAPDSTARARLLAELAGELTWHPDYHRRLAVAAEAVRVARKSGDPGAVISAILRPGAARWVPETSEERVRLCREAVDLAERGNDHIARSEAVHLLAPTLLEAATTDRLDDELAAAAEVAADIREPFMHLISLLVRGCLAIAHGDLERGERDVEEVLRIGRQSGQPDAQAMYDEPLYVIRWHQGRLSEVLPRLRTVAALLPELPTRWSGLACAEAISGDPERARTMLREAAQTDFAMFYGPPWLGCMSQWADVAADLAEADAGATLYTKLLPWKHLFATAGPLPIHAVSLSLGRLAALLGQVETADGHFAEAMLVHEAVRSPFGTAETALHWGRLLLDREPERAAPLLVVATEVADRHGYRYIERRAREALALA